MLFPGNQDKTKNIIGVAKLTEYQNGERRGAFHDKIRVSIYGSTVLEQRFGTLCFLN